MPRNGTYIFSLQNLMGGFEDLNLMTRLLATIEKQASQDQGSFELLRAAQVWRYICVVALTWLAFAALNLYLGFQTMVAVCTVQSIACVVLLLCKPILKPSPFLVCHVFMSLCLVGITATTFGGQLVHRETIFFLPLGIFLASQMIGVRKSLIWAVVICVAILVRYMLFWDHATFRLDDGISMLNALMCSFAIYFICFQAENLFRKRTLKLKQLTRDLKLQNNRIHYLAKTDSLTGLANRYGLSQFFADHIEGAGESGKELAMLLIDFDKFKEINDTVGHRIGDQLLQQVARRLESKLGNDAFVARLGGDEFCILVPEVAGPDEALAWAAKVHGHICKSYQVEDEDLSLGASIGVSLCPSQAQSSVELLTFADTAMYKAKFGDLDYLLYETSMTDELREFRELRDKLAGSLERNEFHLVYQPQICFETGTAFGAEALIRWRHNGEQVLPYKFIPVLESSGMIVEVGRWVVEESCRQLGKWERKGYRYAVSLNVSPKQFSNENFVQEVRDSIQRHNVSPELLDFEITEGLLVEDVEEAIDRLNALKELGCSISIDDFGTGYSSLAYLKQFPIDRLKIDRAFVKDYPETDDGMVASSIVALAKTLKMRVLAEGIETPEQYQFLCDSGCEEYQGYICSRPVGPEECEELFLNYSTNEKIRELAAATS